MTRQNVIWVFGDQHRAQALGHAGDPNLSTPNLDRLAVEGWCPSGISGTPLCCPYRGSLLTSRYPHECVPGHEDPLPDGMPTVARPFNDAGYDTAWFGKWHLAGIREKQGRSALATVPRQKRGEFKTWIGYDNNNAQYDSWVHGHDASGDEVPHYRLPGYETDALTDMLVDYIKAHARAGGPPSAGAGDAAGAAPFFAALSVQPPHDPYLAPAGFIERHNPARLSWRPNVPDVGWVRDQASRELAGYYAMIENIDWNVGRIRDALDEAGLTDSTHIVFFSDHGDMHGSHGLFRKTNPYDEAVRVPMIIAGTSEIYDVSRGPSNLLVNHVDLAPTTLGLAGVPVPDWMEGTNYAGARLGRAARAERGLSENPDYPDSALLQLVKPTGHGDSIDRPWRGVVTRDGWKYVCLEHQPWLMFDLTTDPYEQVNLAHNTRFAAKRRELHTLLANWITRTRDEFPLPEVG